MHQVSIVGQALSTLLVLFFVLVAGNQFLRRLVEILPGFKEKRQAVDISQQIEHDISIYLATVTMMNLLVAGATGLMAWLTGLGSPLLWGTVAFLLNYVPILGPTAGVVIFLVAGLVTIEPLWAAFLPALLYLLIHLAEGETVTPMLLAARFTVNPVLVTIGVLFWYWMWASSARSCRPDAGGAEDHLRPDKCCSRSAFYRWRAPSRLERRGRPRRPHRGCSRSAISSDAERKAAPDYCQGRPLIENQRP